MKFQYNKSLGQNFIYDEGFLDSIVSKLGLSADDTVVEVGTGAGTLTRALARVCKKVITYEIDKRLEPILNVKFAEFKNIELVFADAMKVTDFLTPFKLVANIPYYITTPLLMKFIRIAACTEICVLVQSDVARRIVAKPGGKDYGALSVTLQAVADCKILAEVSRKMFIPAPSVDSAFVVIRKNRAQVADKEIFERLLKGVFAARRKTMFNALRQTFNLSAEEAHKILSQVQINENLRPENVPVCKFARLCEILTKKA